MFSLNSSYVGWVILITKVYYIYWLYIFVLKVNMKVNNEITVKNIQAYMEKTVTKFGSEAKVDCHKELIGKKVFLIIKKGED